MKNNRLMPGQGMLSRSRTLLRSALLLASSLAHGHTANAQCDVAPITGTTTFCMYATTTLNCVTAGGTWSSDNTAVAYVDGAGVVSNYTAVAGTATISYGVSTACGMRYSTTVVNVEDVPHIVINPPYPLLGPGVCLGGTKTFTASAPGGTWSTSNTSVATVDGSGTVAGVSAGYFNLSYTLTNTCGSSPGPVSMNVESLEMIYTPYYSDLCPGSTRQYFIGGGIEHSFASSDTSVARFPNIFSPNELYAVGVGTTVVTITSDLGCTISDVINVNPNPMAEPISGGSSVCADSTLALYNGDPGFWGSSNPSVATVDPYSGLVTGISAGTTDIDFLIFTGNGCYSIPVIHTITVNNNAPNAITGTATVCVGSTTTLSDATTGGTWSSSNTSVATVSSTGIVTGVTSGTANISYAVPGDCGTRYATKVVSVNAIATPAAITGAATVCVGSTTLLSDATSGGAWSSGNTSVATIGSTGVVTGVAAGTAEISYGVTNSCGTGYATVVTTVNDIVTPAAITGTTTICMGATSTIGNSTPGGTWSSSNTSVATIGSTGTVTSIDGGTANVTYTVSNSCGSGYATSTITIEKPVIGAIDGMDYPMCPGSNRHYVNTGNGIEDTWASSNSAVISIPMFYGYATCNNAGTATITLTTTTGCIATLLVTVEPTPVAPPISGPSFVCVGSNISLTNSAAPGSWYSSNSAVADVDPSSGGITGVSTGTANITYQLDHACISTPAVKTVTVGTTPSVATTSGTATVCAGGTTALTNATPGGTWSSGNTSIATVGTSGIVTGVAAGTAAISYGVSNSCGTAYATKTATVNAIPASISGIAAVCAGGSLSLSSATGGGTWASSNGSVATVGTSGTLSATGAGTAIVSYTVSGCVRTASVNVSVAVAAITGTAAVCNGTNSTLACSTGGGTWSSSTTGVATVGSGSGTVTSVSAGTSTISYRVNAGCISTRVYTVNVMPAAITGTGAICVGGSLSLSSTTGGGTWSSSNTARATVGSTTGVVTAVSTGTATITYDLSGCIRTASVNVSAAVAAITGTAVVCNGTNSTLACSTGGGTWSSSTTGVATVNSSSGAVTSVSAGTTTISYRVNAGCINTRVYTVNVQPGTISGSSLIIGSGTLSCSPAGGLWSSSNTARATVGSTSGVVTVVSSGSATITYQFSTGCKSTKSINCIAAKPGRGAEENEVPQVVQVSIFPNPTKGAITIETPSAGTFSIYTMDGRMLAEHTIATQHETISLPQGLAAGMYLCRFTGADGATTTTRLVYEP